jgi:hypothetical protein
MLSETEMKEMRKRFKALTDELEAAGLRPSKNGPLQKKLLNYLLRETGALRPQDLSIEQFEEFFTKTDRMSGDFPGLAQHVESIFQSTQSAPSSTFSVSDLKFLKAVGISPLPDLREPLAMKG